MSRIIRKYEPQDIEAVLSAWESASRVGHPFLSEAFLAEERDLIRDVYMPSPLSNTWVIEQDRKVIGFISMLGNEVGGLFVHSDFHGTGAGWALMDKAKSLHETLELEVFEENSVGRRFYEKYGFVLVERKLDEDAGHYALRLRFPA